MKQIEITNFLKTLYPEELASSFDIGIIGLQIGSNNKEIKKVMIALDATTNVINEAIEKKCDLLITHHPMIFSSILSIDYDSILGNKIVKIIENKLNIYSMHTNFDVASGGMNDILANKIGLKEISTQHNIIDKDSLIRIGYVYETTLETLASNVACALNENGVKFIGDAKKRVSKIGIVGGAGSSEISTAINLNCDCLITGEVRHHQALEVLESNFSVIEVSHFVESLFKMPVLRILKNQFPNLEIVLAEAEKNPFTLVEKC